MTLKSPAKVIRYASMAYLRSKLVRPHVYYVICHFFRSWNLKASEVQATEEMQQLMTLVSSIVKVHSLSAKLSLLLFFITRTLSNLYHGYFLIFKLCNETKKRSRNKRDYKGPSQKADTADFIVYFFERE